MESTFRFNQSSFYLYECEYQSYLEQRVDNEQRLLRMLNSKLNLREAVLLEASTADKIKAKWNKLVEFLKGLFAKFMESMSNVLLSNKEYLEKYKDIILNKKPKPDIEFSYTGNYPLGIERLTKVEIPQFMYSTYKDALEKESQGPLVKQIIPDNDLIWDENEKLSDNLKVYFTGGNNQTEGKLDDGQLNFTDMYNFCHDWEKIKKIVQTDQNRITASTSSINAFITDAMKNDQAQTQNNNGQPNNPPAGDNSGASSTGTGSSDASNGQPNTKKEYTGGGSISWNGNVGTITAEGPDKGKKVTRGNDGKTYFESALLEKVNVTNTNATSQMTSTGSNQSEDKNKVSGQDAVDTANKGEGSQEDKINAATKAVDKWGDVCRSIVGAKLTAVEQIAKDYMAIIREHVRSYGGKDLKNKADNKAKQQGTDYGTKDQNNQKENNEDLQQQKNQQGK